MTITKIAIYVHRHTHAPIWTSQIIPSLLLHNKPKSPQLYYTKIVLCVHVCFVITKHLKASLKDRKERKINVQIKKHGL